MRYPATFASYPSSSTAAMIACSSNSPSTFAEFVASVTCAAVTPATFWIASVT